MATPAPATGFPTSAPAKVPGPRVRTAVIIGLVVGMLRRNPTASWHPDPTGEHRLRSWDGSQRTEHTSE